MELRRGIYAIVDVGACVRSGREPLDVARSFCGAPIAALQLRAKEVPDDRLVETARAMASICRAAGVAFLVNDRADVARLVDADGVHLGQDDLPPDRGRAIVGPARLVGWSTHDAAQVEAAAAAPVDYVGFGPVFVTATKERPDPVVGLEGLRAAVRRSRRPVVAIGGIRLEHIPAVRDTGAHAIALVSALMDGEPAALVAEAVRVFGSAR
jgi:thiamine-phosphate pyrophosphorylase